jgi:hypothetical protein
MRLLSVWHCGCIHCRVECNSQGSTVDLKNRLVSFRIVDVYHPDPAELLRSVYGQSILQGQVTDSTEDAGPDGYLVVQFKDFPEPLIVPMRAVIGVL